VPVTIRGLVSGGAIRGLLGPFWLVKIFYAGESSDSNIEFGDAISTVGITGLGFDCNQR
jgi:hypothetical protein